MFPFGQPSSGCRGPCATDVTDATNTQQIDTTSDRRRAASDQTLSHIIFIFSGLKDTATFRTADQNHFMHSTAHRPQVQANGRPSSNSAGDLPPVLPGLRERTGFTSCGAVPCFLHSTEGARPASDHTSLHDGHFFCEDQLVRRKPVAAEFICGKWPVVNSDRVQFAPNRSADFGISDKSSNADKQFPLRAPLLTM
ncbi:MAG: hypothetical protein CM1200mP2_54850 [Planctomycetaceae bacterium]|nr:MAG: hypothetical protein CM1200mP2_54850 [Planctomycetaceae bacterium]